MNDKQGDVCDRERITAGNLFIIGLDLLGTKVFLHLLVEVLRLRLLGVNERKLILGHCEGCGSGMRHEKIR